MFFSRQLVRIRRVTTTPKITMAATHSSTTFRVSDVEMKSIDTTVTTKASISQLRQYAKNHCTEVLMETPFSSNVRANENNGFVDTVIYCYNNHHNLIIRPDDIWTAIMTQFSFYINANAEEFRNKFVNFEGKKELTVAINGTLRNAPYDLFVTLMTEKINENLVDDAVKDWVLPNFTTTTTNDIISCGIVLMATTKKYFDFGCCLCCGIPYVTLEGSVHDWENILKRLDKLKSYKLDKWYDLLEPILREFVAAKKNEPNIDFWNRVCHYSYGGSGPTFISGWLTAFAVFDEEGNFHNLSFDEEDLVPNCCGKIWPHIDIQKIPSGIVTVNVKIRDMNGDYESLMIAGHVAFEVLEDDFTLKPRIGWGMALKLTAEEIEEVHEYARGLEYYCDSCKVEIKELSDDDSS